MTVDTSLLGTPPYLEAPQGLAGWLGWIVYLAVLIYLLWRWRGYSQPWNRVQWGIFLGLLILLPLTSLFFVVHLPAANVLPFPDKPLEELGPAAVIFSILPLMLSAGLLGVAPAAAIGLASGLLSALYETHNPFTILTFALWGVFLGFAFQQRYRTTGFGLLRHPLVGALILTVVYPFFFLVENILVVGRSLAASLDYAFTWAFPAWGAAAIEFFLAGLCAEIIARTLPHIWGSKGALQPSPNELHLQNRFIARLTPMMLLLVIALVVGDWYFAGNAAGSMLQDRMSSTTETAAQTVPYFMETGQNLIQQFASDNLWYQGTSEQMSAQLSENLRTFPFFHELYLLDARGNPLNGVPTQNFLLASPTPEEYSGVQLALNGVPFQSYTIAPTPEDTAARMSFLASIYDENAQLRGVLVGRTDLETNPLMQPAISSLQGLEDLEGEGMLIDGNGQVVYHSTQPSTLEAFSGPISEEGDFYEEAAPDGTRRLVYTQPVEGSPWAVAVKVPSSQAQQLALKIAAPLLVMVLVVFVVITAWLLYTLRSVITSLSNLAQEANRLSSGQLDQPVQVVGDDEVGQLGRAFESMRSNLKARLDELNCLVVVSQQVAASLEFEEAVKPLLEAALSTGACAARVVLTPEAVPETQGSVSPTTRFSAGPGGELYSNLDEQILVLVRQQERIALTNLPRVRLLNFPQGTPRPESILALALRHESLYSGALWLAYDTPHQFPKDEVNFITTLASQTALALANARLFARAEVGRQRLAAILNSTPDPVLVTDHRDRLLLANPAAWQVLGLGVEAGQGQPIEQILSQAELVRMLRTFSESQQSTEVSLSDGKTYLAMASGVIVDSRPVGRICILRDITHFKELDAMKSDFVATVSHDLRSPLTLIHGYTTMLEMVGNLNEQQTNFVRQIIASVDGMTHLVRTLLDLGRIEAGIDMQFEMVSIHDIIDRVVASIQMQASQKQITITTHIDPLAPPLMEAHPALLQQALHNLVDNAVNYTDPGGKVAISISPNKDWVVFEVSDNGIGIAPVDLPHLFEKFYRGGQKEAKRRQGTGLGLAIVKSVVERHRGQVWAESQLGKGSRFYFSLPFRQRDRKNTPEPSKR